jgi:RNA polymerase sigma-70 factor (ECF subfamily)
MDAGSLTNEGGQKHFDDLLLLARQGSKEALGRVLESCRRVLLRAAKRQIPAQIQTKRAASDVVQETFLEAQRDFEQFVGSTREELAAWLFRILQNNCTNLVYAYRYRRKREISREVRLNDASLSLESERAVEARNPGPSKLAIVQEESKIVSSALRQLPDHHRTILQLRFTDRLSFKEIGDRLGCSAEAARKIFNRTLRQLREDCNPLTDSETGEG